MAYFRLKISTFSKMVFRNIYIRNSNTSKISFSFYFFGNFLKFIYSCKCIFKSQKLKDFLENLPIFNDSCKISWLFFGLPFSDFSANFIYFTVTRELHFYNSVKSGVKVAWDHDERTEYLPNNYTLLYRIKGPLEKYPWSAEVVPVMKSPYKILDKLKPGANITMKLYSSNKYGRSDNYTEDFTTGGNFLEHPVLLWRRFWPLYKIWPPTDFCHSSFLNYWTKICLSPFKISFFY